MLTPKELDAAMDYLGVTGNAMAVYSESHAPVISMYRNGWRMPSAEVAERIERWVGILKRARQLYGRAFNLNDVRSVRAHLRKMGGGANSPEQTLSPKFITEFCEH